MGTKLVGPCLNGDYMDPSIPPGFESFVPAASQAVKINTQMELNDDSALTPLKRRPGVKSNPVDSTSGDESEQLKYQLPKGVTRGCEVCPNCQNVTAKWRPEEARRPDLVDAPVFYPSEEEFEDTLKYISSIRARAEMYGICRIVPPPSWKPPPPFKDKDIWERSKFDTRVQRIDKLQNRESMKKVLEVNHNKKRKKRKCMKNGVARGISNSEINFFGEVGANDTDEWFGFEPGPEFTFDEFHNYADDFKSQYFRNDNNTSDTSIESIEGEYWRMVEKPTEEIEVLYGADLETGVFGSGFPKSPEQVGSASDVKYVNSGWNLNNFPRLPDSILSFESSDISGVLVPWLYVGMCFSSFCWHVEDHHLYSLNYLHWGDPKLWYGVPGSDALKLEASMQKHLPDLFEEQPDLLHKLVTQLSPSILKCEGVPVFRCVQKQGEFVLTFPRAYHAGFNCGFNCAEAVNVAPVDWLPHGQNAIELYREQGRKTSISHDKLLLGAAREAVKAYWGCNLFTNGTSSNLRWRDVCGKDGLLTKALKTRVDTERLRREFLCKSSKALKMESSFDANSERECSVCFFDLHLSAAGCHHCSPDKYACLYHAKKLCSCSWGSKFFLFRYEIFELNFLVEALEENKLSSIYRWARLDLGLSLSSYISNDGKPDARAMISSAALKSSKEQKGKTDGDIINSNKCMGSVSSPEKLKPPVVVLALGNVKEKGNSLKTLLNDSTPSQLHNLQTPSVQNLTSEKSEEAKNVIILIDDEEDLAVNEPSANHSGSTYKTICPDNVASVGISTNKLPSKISVTGSSAVLDKKQASISQCFKVEDPVRTDLCSNNPVITVKRRFDHDQEFKLQCDADDSNQDDSDTKLYDVDLRLIESQQTISCSASGAPSSIDRNYRQKGPRIAKIVRRVSRNIELVNVGTVREGKLWCDSRVIYPKGFKSRVKYIDVVDPTNICYYISEIIDAGGDGGPLFMVFVEDTPSEVFIHVSAAKCWEMVRERVNHEITKQHKLRRSNLPALQPPGSLDGMEMFGFSSPAILQAIQNMDENRSSVDYWKSRPLVQNPQQSQSVESASDLKSQPKDDHNAGRNHAQVETILGGLLKKANPEELQTLYSHLYSKNSCDEKGLLIRLINEEIHKKPCVRPAN